MNTKHIKSEFYSLLGIIAIAAFVASFFWIAIASAVWQWRNPKANQTTTITHFGDMIHFRKLDKFQ